jgi:hypothetical protein
MLSAETIKELDEILKADYGLNLSSGEVFEVAQGLTAFFDKLSECEASSRQIHVVLRLKVASCASEGAQEGALSPDRL